MRVDVIREMMADPNIDPTSWVGQALIEWVERNPHKVLNDPLAREYLFRACEAGDLSNLTKGVIEQYKQERSLSILKSFIRRYNEVIGSASDSTGWYGGRIISALDGLADPSTIDLLVTIRATAHTDQNSRFIENLRPRHIIQVLQNRDLTMWTTGSWRLMLNLLEKDILSTFKSYIWPQFTRRAWNEPDVVQDLLYQVFLGLEPWEAKGWLTFLEETDASLVWKNREHLVSKHLSGPLKLNEQVCRCGYAAASKSGHALHLKTCGEGRPNLYQAAKVFLAISTPGSTICTSCGRNCKTASGLTQHKASCTSDIGTLIIEDRKIAAEQKISDRAKASDPISPQDPALPAFNATDVTVVQPIPLILIGQVC